MTAIARPSRSGSAQVRGDQPRRGIFRTLRWRLLVSVNLVVGVGLAVFLLIDYRHQLESRVASHRTALSDEARSLLPGIAAIGSRGPGALQAYIDEVCASMQESSSPGHHIVVEYESGLIQARSHHRASESMLTRIREAAATADGRTPRGMPEFLVGSATSGTTRAFIAERIEPLVADTRGQALVRASALAGAALLAAVIVNLILVQLVTRPLDRLATVVRRIGAGELGVTADGLGTDELNLIADEINAMSAKLARRTRDRESQLDKARRLQSYLNPQAVSTSTLTVAVDYRPADAVAGDYFDVLAQESGAALVCLADVCGHGIPAAMGAAILKALLLTAVEQTTDPEQLLRQVNDRFHRVSLPEDFASMMLARIAPDGEYIDYASAGHEPGYVVRADGAVETLDSTGLLLGVYPGGSWNTQRVRLGAGDKIVLVTDGLPEVYDAESRLFGRDNVVAVLEAHHTDSPTALAAALIAAADGHAGNARRSDDQTILVIQVSEHRCASGTEHRPLSQLEADS